MRPLRFGISFGGAMSETALRQALMKAEDFGFSVVCTADHLTERHAALPFLATVAAISPLRVSPMVIANDYRHPVVTARDSATIDILSNGRFELGIGTGWIKEQYDSAGIDYDRPGVRVDRLEEAIGIIKGLWTGEPFSFSGDHYSLDEIKGPKTVQRPRPPLLIAGSGPRMMQLAGREADIVGISPLRPSIEHFDEFGPSMATSGGRISQQLQWLEQGAGDRLDQIELSVTINHLKVTDNPDSDLEKLADAWVSTPSDIATSLHTLVGSQGQLADTIRKRYESHGLSYVVFGAQALDDIGPVVARLVG